MRTWGRTLAVLVTAVAVTGATTTVRAEEPGPVAGAEAGPTRVGGVTPEAVVPLPDLGVAHRLPGGGLNLWRLPLSELEAGYGTPQVVRTLDYGGFSYDNSVTLAGDFGDITASDDGTADHVIWHRQPNGGVLVWGVGGGSDPTPQLWQDLRTGGWSYAASQPMVADVSGDGYDDLVAIHSSRNAYGAVTANVWVFLNNGFRLSAPQLWTTLINPPSRYLMSDVNADGAADLIEVGMSYNFATSTRDVSYMARLNQGASFSAGYYHLFQGATTAGWSIAESRQLAGDVDGDGLTDMVTAHAQAGGGALVWVHRGCAPAAFWCTRPPEIWQDLRGGGWSFAGSRQHLADTDGDGRDDLVSVHSQAGGPGELVWRALSTGSGFASPQIVADLKTGGWTYSASRESVARTYGNF